MKIKVRLSGIDTYTRRGDCDSYPQSTSSFFEGLADEMREDEVSDALEAFCDKFDLTAQTPDDLHEDDRQTFWNYALKNAMENATDHWDGDYRHSQLSGDVFIEVEVPDDYIPGTVLTGREVIEFPKHPFDDMN